MDTKRRSRRGTGSSIRCAALLLAFAVAAPARAANQLEAVATLQYQSTLYGGEYKSDSFWQFYRLGWANPDVTSVFGYNLGLNYEDQRGPLVAPGAPVYYRSLSPRMTLNYGNGPLSLNLIYVFNWAQNDLPQLSLNSYVHSLTIAAGYQPSLAWNLSARYSRIMNSGPEPGASSISDVGSASASYGVDVWSAGANVLLASNQSYSFDLPGVSQLRVAPGLSASFNPVLIPDRLSMSVAGNASYSWSQTTVQGGGPSAVVPVQLLPVAGLYANVNPPNNTTLTPMTPLPSLIDRDIDTSTGVDLGPTGMSYQNIGVDMGRLAFLDSFYVYVRDASGRFVPSPGPISWTAWSSQDGNQWTPLASTYVYDQGLSRFVVTFTSVEARYFKVVSFDVNLIPTFVTELTPLIHQVVTQAVGYLTSGWSVNANAGLSYHPVSQVSMNYNIGVNNSASSVPGVSNATRSWTQGGDVSYAPTNLVSGSISGGMSQQYAAGSATLTSMFAGAAARYSPETAQVSLFGNVNRSSFADTLVSSISGGASLSLQPLEAMNAAITGSVTRSEINGELTTSLGGIASLSLALLRSLDLTASASFSRQVIGTANVPAGVPINPIQNYSTYAAGLIWRASQQLYLQARISYFTFEGVSGLGQGFLIGWYPFPGGPLQLSASYAYDVDSISGQVSRRARIDANYYFSRHITLGAAYSSDFGNGGPSQQSIFLTLSLRL